MKSRFGILSAFLLAIVVFTACVPTPTIDYSGATPVIVPNPGVGTVTSTATAGRIPYMSTNTNLANSSIYYKILNGYIGIFQNNPLYQLDVTGTIHSTGDVNSDQDINATNDLNAGNDLDVGDDLTVHGDIIVTGTVDGVDVSDHDARHMWGAADALNIKDLMMAVGEHIFLNYEDGTNWTTTLGGTGTATVTKLAITPKTGATSGGTAGVVLNVQAFYHWTGGANAERRTSFRFEPQGSTDLAEVWIGWFPNTTTFPTNTCNHYAVKYLSIVNGTNATLYGSCGNGAAGTQATNGLTLSANNQVDIFIQWDRTTINYYYSLAGGAWTLLATNTTNTMTSAYGYFGIWVKNSEDVTKNCLLTGVRTMAGAIP